MSSLTPHTDSSLRFERGIQRSGTAVALLFFVGLMVFAMVPAAVGAESGPALAHLETLGAEATVYRLHLLDPEGGVLPAGTSKATSLLLEVSRPGAEPLFLPVPGTDSAQSDKSPRLTFSRESQTLLITWEAQINSLHSKIRVVGYREQDGFVDFLDLIGNPYYSKQRPQALLTSDAALWRPQTEPGADGEPGTGDETEGGSEVRELAQRVLHLVWREGQGHIFYSALAEGTTGVSTSDPINLSTLFPNLTSEIHQGIDGTLSLVPGRDNRTALVSFIDPVQNSVEIVEVSSLPIELSILADAGFDSIRSREGDSGADLISTAEAARSHIVFIGRRLVSESAAGLLSREVAQSVMASEDDLDEGWIAVAEEARSHIVFIGRSLRLSGNEADGDAFNLAMPMPLRDEIAIDEINEPTVNLSIRHSASMELPEGAPHDSEIVVSTDGARALLYWFDGQTVHYTEGSDRGWSDIYSLSSEQTGSLANAERLLRNRFRDG